jgi:hypothetical protein
MLQRSVMGTNLFAAKKAVASFRFLAKEKTKRLR